jgi:hypothetical protein
MVYRISDVYRRRIDEIAPFFRGAELREEADETVLIIPSGAAPDAPRAEIRAMPAGFYVHWTATKARFDRAIGSQMPEQDLRNALFAHIATWTEPISKRESYADFNRKTGDLAVGRYRLVPFAANPALSVRLIEEGIEEIAAYRDRVEATVRERMAKMVAEQATAPASA